MPARWGKHGQKARIAVVAKAIMSSRPPLARDAEGPREGIGDATCSLSGTDCMQVRRDAFGEVVFVVRGILLS